MHYRRWRVHGDPLSTKRPDYGKGRSLLVTGYVRVWAPGHPVAGPDGYALEHRKVMHDAGFDVTGRHVHHRNHDKTDNRLENLAIIGASEHAVEHLRENGYVRNQYGTWPIRQQRGRQA